MTHLNWQQFYDKYVPIKNTFVKNAPCDGFLFEDRSLLRDIPNIRIFTLLDDNKGEEMYIINGCKIINSIGYLITTQSWIPNEIIEVRLEEGYEVKN